MADLLCPLVEKLIKTTKRNRYRNRPIKSIFVLLRRYLIPIENDENCINRCPATGKTTVSQALEELGHQVFHEQAREIISDSLEKGSDILPWKDLMGFTDVVWNLRNEQYDSAVLGTKSFYDRTVLDSYAYLFKRQC